MGDVPRCGCGVDEFGRRNDGTAHGMPWDKCCGYPNPPADRAQFDYQNRVRFGLKFLYSHKAALAAVKLSP